MDGWSSDEDLFGGGMSLEELATQNADKLIKLFESADEKLYNDASRQTEQNDGEADESIPVIDIQEQLGYFADEPPPEPCHLEWTGFTNLRIRGEKIDIQTENLIDKNESLHIIEEEVLAIHPKIVHKDEVEVNETQNDDCIHDIHIMDKAEMMKQIWNRFILECKEHVENEKENHQIV